MKTYAPVIFIHIGTVHYTQKGWGKWNINGVCGDYPISQSHYSVIPFILCQSRLRMKKRTQQEGGLILEIGK